MCIRDRNDHVHAAVYHFEVIVKTGEAPVSGDIYFVLDVFSLGKGIEAALEAVLEQVTQGHDLNARCAADTV